MGGVVNVLGQIRVIGVLIIEVCLWMGSLVCVILVMV